MRHIVWTSALALALGLTDVVPAKACAPAPPPEAFVQIAEETALIVWNVEAKQEHFIRRGAFRTGAKDFGFLVPTPSKPELEAVPDKVLSQFEEMIRPEVVTANHYDVNPFPLLLFPLYLLPRLGSAVPAAAVAPARPWLTVFEDSSSPRPGTDDLFFSKSPDQAEIKPPPIIYNKNVHIPLPLDVIGLVAFIGWRIRKRVAKTKS